MARNIFPRRFTDKCELFRLVKEKHDADGAESVLTAYLATKEISLTDDERITANALGAHKLSGKHTRDAEKEYRLRDSLLTPAFREHKKCVQFLKTALGGNARNLSEWSVSVTGANEVVYPTGFVDLSANLLDFIAKHESYATGTSPLTPFLLNNGYDLVRPDTRQVAKHLLGMLKNKTKKVK